MQQPRLAVPIRIHERRRSSISIAAALVLAALGWPGPAAAGVWQKIAAEGEDGPDGRPHGSLLLGSRIAGDGAVSFADVLSDSTSPGLALWRWSEASGTQLVGTLGGPVTDAWARPELFASDAGDLALREGSGPEPVGCGGGTTEQASERLHAVPRTGAPALVAATGAPAPGAPMLTVARLMQVVGGGGPITAIWHFAPPSLDPGGALTFVADTADDPCFDDPSSSLPAAVFAPDGAGGIALVARAGDPLPGAGDGEVIRINSAQDSFERIAASGTVFLVSQLGEPPDPSPSALLRWRPGTGLETVVRPGEPAEFADGATLADLELPASSPSGTIALVAQRAAGDDSPDPEGVAIWTGDSEGVSERWPLAGPVPGAPEGAVFVTETGSVRGYDHGTWLQVNDAGEVAFLATFRAAPEAEASVGLFGPDANGDPVLRLVVGESGHGGRTFESLEPVHLAADGTLLVRAALSGPLVGSYTDMGWYLLPRDGAPRVLLRLGDEVEIAPGDVRHPSFFPDMLTHDATLGRFAMRFGRPGEPTAIAVRTVPEPGASAAAAIAAAALGLCASRRGARRRRTVG